jgi:recombination protein RecR
VRSGQESGTPFGAHGGFVSQLPDPIRQLITALHRLPGIGPRSAERLALHIVQSEPQAVQQLAQALVAAREKVHACTVCGSLTEKSPCAICSHPQRDASIICVVERATDILSLEKTGSYRGHYHVLGGKISPINGVGPEDLNLAALQHRTAQPTVKEVILALSSDVEGDATAHYLAQRLARSDLAITRLAQGIPVGSGLEFADELTLGRALEGRKPLG